MVSLVQVSTAAVITRVKQILVNKNGRCVYQPVSFGGCGRRSGSGKMDDPSQLPLLIFTYDCNGVPIPYPSNRDIHLYTSASIRSPSNREIFGPGPVVSAIQKWAIP